MGVFRRAVDLVPPIGHLVRRIANRVAPLEFNPSGGHQHLHKRKIYRGASRALNVDASAEVFIDLDLCPEQQQRAMEAYLLRLAPDSTKGVAA